MTPQASGALIFNNKNELLIVNPTYKDLWEIPGGIVESGESPRAACVRELHEELGLHIKVGNLLSVVHTPASELNSDSLQFIFHGGKLSKLETDSIALPFDELSEWRFIQTGQIEAFLPATLGRRVRHALSNLAIKLNSYEDYGVLEVQ